MPDPPYLTFASHASGDRVASEMTKVFKRLKELLSIKAPGKGPQYMFTDCGEIGLGDKWEERLEAEGGSCVAFLFFVSPSFVDSEWCGREVAVALRRLEHWEKGGQPSAKARFLYPLLWELNPLDELRKHQDAMPAPLKPYQYTPPGAPPEYKKDGLRRMVSFRKNTKVEILLDLIATAVIQGTSHGSLPPLTPADDFKKIPSAWKTVPGKYGIAYHLAQGLDASVAQEVTSRAEVMKINCSPLPPKAANERKQQVKDAAAAGELLLIVADIAQPPDDVLLAAGALESANLAVLLAGQVPGSSDSGTAAVESWLSKHFQPESSLWKAAAQKRVVQGSGLELGPQMEIVVARTRSAMIKADEPEAVPDLPQKPGEADSPSALLVKPSIAGPGGAS